MRQAAHPPLLLSTAELQQVPSVGAGLPCLGWVPLGLQTHVKIVHHSLRAPLRTAFFGTEWYSWPCVYEIATQGTCTTWCHCYTSRYLYTTCTCSVLHKKSGLAKLHIRFCYQIVHMQGFVQFCIELLVQFAYLCRLSYRTVLSALLRCTDPVSVPKMSAMEAAMRALTALSVLGASDITRKCTWSLSGLW